MSFDDLPPDWRQRPLTDPRLVADVLDLVVTERSRRAGALYLLLCDAENRLLQPIAIDELERGATVEERTALLRVIIGAAEQASDDGSVLIAIARRDGLSATADDQRWARAALGALTSWRLLGVHVVTVRGSRPVPRPASAA